MERSANGSQPLRAAKQLTLATARIHNMRIAAIIIGLSDALACAIIAVAMYNSGSDPATIGFDYAAGVIVTGLFVVTGLPGLVMTFIRRAPKTALALALAFPAIFIPLFAAAVILLAKAI